MLLQILLTQMNDTVRIIAGSRIDQRLHALAIAHFVLALVAGTLSGLALIAAIAFSTSMSGMLGGSASDTLSLFQDLGVGTALIGLVLSVVTAAAGWNLAVRRWRAFGLVLEVGTLLLFPFGTVLAVLTLTVLTRQSVWKRFAADYETAKA